VFAHLGPANSPPRTGLGWQIERFLGYFAVTCFSMRKSFVFRCGVTIFASDLLPNFLLVISADAESLELHPKLGPACRLFSRRLVRAGRAPLIVR
jgi:hypothetical protein